MTLATLIQPALFASISLLVFALALGARADEATYLFRHPWLLLRSIVAMNVIMPIFVVFAAMFIDLPPAIKIALVALAVSPVPPVLQIRQEKAGGAHSYSVGLLMATSVASLVVVPAAIELIGRLFQRDVHMTFDRVLPVALITVIAPLSIGIAVSRLLPHFSGRIAKPVAIGAAALLALAIVPVLVMDWRLIRGLVGQGVMLVLVLFTLVGLLVGHAMGGPDPDNRTVLALATSTRHPGIAMAIASLNFPNEKAASAVILFHLLVGAVASLPYLLWRRRVHAALTSP